jgi:hypothetical protein
MWIYHIHNWREHQYWDAGLKWWPTNCWNFNITWYNMSKFNFVLENVVIYSLCGRSSQNSEVNALVFNGLLRKFRWNRSNNDKSKTYSIQIWLQQY